LAHKPAAGDPSTFLKGLYLSIFSMDLRGDGEAHEGESGYYAEYLDEGEQQEQDAAVAEQDKPKGFLARFSRRGNDRSGI